MTRRHENVHLTEPMPPETRRALMRELEANPAVRRRESELIDEQLATMDPRPGDGFVTVAQRAAARGFARKVLVAELKKTGGI